jgi:hypothetical protein
MTPDSAARKKPGKGRFKHYSNIQGRGLLCCQTSTRIPIMNHSNIVPFDSLPKWETWLQKAKYTTFLWLSQKRGKLQFSSPTWQHGQCLTCYLLDSRSRIFLIQVYFAQGTVNALFALFKIKFKLKISFHRRPHQNKLVRSKVQNRW